MTGVVCGTTPFTKALAGGLGDGERLGLRSADRRGIFRLGLLGSGFDEPWLADADRGRVGADADAESSRELR